MDITTQNEDLPYQPSKCENPTYILPDLNMDEELQDVKDPLKLESKTKILPDTEMEEDMLDIKEEPDIFEPIIVYGDDAEECNTDYKNVKLRDGSDEDQVSFCGEETVDNSTDLQNTASPDYGMQISPTVEHSALPDCKITSVYQYCTDIVNTMYKKRKTSTVQSTKIQMSLHETIKGNEAFVQYNTSEQTLRCNENKPYTCDICHKFFSTPSSLKRHIIVHTGSKLYTCDICHKSFTQLGTLKTHNRIHTGNKPYMCDFCHTCFNQFSHLKTHLRLHTGSKPYTCETCNKCFSQMSNLRTHTRIHTGSKPYTCDTCHKCFSQLSNLKKHLTIHTGNRP